MKNKDFPIDLRLEGENSEDFGLVPNPSIFVTF